MLLRVDALYVGGFILMTEGFVDVRTVVLARVHAEVGEGVLTVLAVGGFLVVTGAVGGLVRTLGLLRSVDAFFSVVSRQEAGPRGSQVALEVGLSSFVGLFEVLGRVHGELVVFGPLILATSVILSPLSFGTISVDVVSVLTLVLAEVSSLVITILVAVLKVTIFLRIAIVILMLGVNVLWRVLRIVRTTIIVIILMITTVIIHIIVL